MWVVEVGIGDVRHDLSLMKMSASDLRLEAVATEFGFLGALKSQNLPVLFEF